MIEVSAYQASDGNIFKSIQECQEHEISLVWRDRIGEFNKSGLNPYPNGAQSSIAKKIIIAWEQFKTGA